ncbi:MAG TPA: GGDEF domain-containing protein [Solirubrobacterales bacterium]|nr:GGDEF domain-containing protein [Solirubrobacterales bacterium]
MTDHADSDLSQESVAADEAVVASTAHTVRTARHRAGDDPAPALPQSMETLAAIHKDARRERLLDMERRVRRYRTACFAILAVALASAGPEVGWGWIVPLALGLCGFAVADRFMYNSERPGLWIAGAWGALPLLLAGAVIATGGPTSPALVWFALPAVTLGVRFEPRGMVMGTAYIIALFLLSTVAVDPADAADHSQTLTAAAALILSTVILSGALVESDRAHRRRSTLDPLTGLFNRNALEQRLAELDGQPSNAEEGLSHALLLCDLDHFKRVNDQLGHAAGDAVLQDVAYVMRATLRAGDSIYRVGGEEILVVLPGADREDAIEIAERLRVAVRERRPVGVTVTVSIGVAVSQPERVNTDDLIARADAALYAAKAGGRDAVRVDVPAPEPVSG